MKERSKVYTYGSLRNLILYKIETDIEMFALMLFMSGFQLSFLNLISIPLSSTLSFKSYKILFVLLKLCHINIFE